MKTTVQLSTGDIEALLGDEHSDTDDVNNFNKVIKIWMTGLMH